MLRGNGGGHIVTCFQNKACGFGSGDVFEHDFQIRHLRQNGFHHALDESGFAVEDVDVGIGYFAVNQKAHVLHSDFVQHGQQFEQIGYAGIRVGGGARRIKFEGHDTSRFGFAYKLGRGLAGQIKRHQRLKRAAFGQGGNDALFVGQRVGHTDDGRL